MHDDEFIQIESTPSGWCILISVNKSKGQINKLVAYDFYVSHFLQLNCFKNFRLVSEVQTLRTISHLPVDIFMVVQDIQH